jgi:transcriptional regulator with XRE-family HTH domain
MKNGRLKLAIFESGVKQKELALKTGIPNAYISMGINGRYVFTEFQMRKIAEVLGRPVRTLFKGKQHAE